jgi:hypothetical protein
VSFELLLLRRRGAEEAAGREKKTAVDATEGQIQALSLARAARARQKRG